MIRMIIEMDPENAFKVRVAHPENKMYSDYMLAEAKRILDRKDDKVAAGEQVKSVLVPDRTLSCLGGVNG